MGLYSRFVFLHLCELALNRAPLTDQRHSLLRQVAGRILEIGFGTGLNLAHYPPSVERITVVDPNLGMLRRARRRVAASGILVEHVPLACERLPFADASFDTVVSTFTFCSITHLPQALAELYRVLRPGGRLLYLEHGLAPDPAVQKWQHRLNGLEKLLADNCHLNRHIPTFLAAQPFELQDAAEFYLPSLPRTHGYLYRGMAIKS